jgi:hypothetical protein
MELDAALHKLKFPAVNNQCRCTYILSLLITNLLAVTVVTSPNSVNYFPIQIKCFM